VGGQANKESVNRVPFQNISKEEYPENIKPKRKVPLAYSKKKNMAKSMIKEQSKNVTIA
jgi:hypothetical protein